MTASDTAVVIFGTRGRVSQPMGSPGVTSGLAGGLVAVPTILANSPIASSRDRSAGQARTSAWAQRAQRRMVW